MTEINELHIRVPGMHAEAGENLGRMVAEKVAAALPAGDSDRYIPELRINIQSSISEDTELMADRIAGQIILRINSIISLK